MGKIIRVASARVPVMAQNIVSFQFQTALRSVYKTEGINQTAITNFIIAIPNHGKNES